jgi:hypothetical protein
MFANTRSVTRNLMAWARSIPDEEWYAAPEPYKPTAESLAFERSLTDEVPEARLVATGVANQRCNE